MLLAHIKRLFKKSVPDSLDRDTVYHYKQEAADLLKYHSYEDIGKAFLEATRKLDAMSFEDVERSYFVHRVSFTCFLNLQRGACK